jgi:hypothetical protein
MLQRATVLKVFSNRGRSERMTAGGVRLAPMSSGTEKAGDSIGTGRSLLAESDREPPLSPAGGLAGHFDPGNAVLALRVLLL